MTDLLQVLPGFDVKPYAHLLPSLDKALVTTNDLLTLDPTHVARRAVLPAGELRKLVAAVVSALHRQLDFASFPNKDRWACISTLDDGLDAALGGGIPPGYLVEITGESGVGKTQLLLTLLLAAQLPFPHGLSKSAVYISTEAPLATNRLTQLLSSHPVLASLPIDKRPSLSRILSIQTPDLEFQEHILRYQLPVAVKKHNLGLVILDSVAANFRAELDKEGGGNGAAFMARRGAQLMQLGALLRELARAEGIAVVVANQVADRFARPAFVASSNSVSRTASAHSQTGSRTASVDGQSSGWESTPQSSSQAMSHVDSDMVLSADPLTLHHQQQWFTGWGDGQHEPAHAQKTPSLGLVWTNQLACRIALIKQPVLASRSLLYAVGGEESWNEHDAHVSKWRRWFKVVFAPWVAPSEGRGIEVEIQQQGMTSIAKQKG